MDSLIQSPRRTSLLRSLEDEVDRLFESTFPGSTREAGEPRSPGWTPRIDLIETDEHYGLRADLPGIAKEDVSITVENGQLIIRGERKHETMTEDEDVVRSERAFGRFHRMLRLPQTVDQNKIEATFEDGVLSVELPKTEASKPKKIDIS